MGGVLSCVSRALAPLGTAHPPLFRGGRASRHSHGTCFTHSSPRMPGFRGESPLKTLRQWAGEGNWSSTGPRTAHLGPTHTVFGAGSHRKSHRDEAMIKESFLHRGRGARFRKVTGPGVPLARSQSAHAACGGAAARACSKGSLGPPPETLGLLWEPDVGLRPTGDPC